MHAITVTGSDETPLAKYFEGPIPQIGDSVELYCCARSEGKVELKFRVIEPAQPETKP